MPENRTKVRFAVSCSSNMNRSMEAHNFMKRAGFLVESFGCGSQVKLPGTTIEKPNCYEFGPTTYDYIYNDLKTKDRRFYTRNGLLNILDRNRKIKDKPERFQNQNQEFDVVLCLEERVYVTIVEFLQKRKSLTGERVHVINIDIRDNLEEATLGASVVCEMCEAMESASNLDDEMEELLVRFEKKNPTRNLIYTLCFY
uniref:RNA polymerase II subunit A C-terminal domain phosphatase SSU72 n=1 Tax=Rhabditophanes sp. KR3021 TaxID=114890 RepID=A0AC35UED6_9BILA